jgi:hypothetical protein
MRSLCAISIVVACSLFVAPCLAQEGTPVAPFTHTSGIEAEALDAERAKTLSEFLRRSPSKQNRSALTGGFCKPILTQATPSPDYVKVALALVESEIVPILSFSKVDEGGGEAASVNYSIEFDLDHINLRSSNPRYQSQANGLRVSYPHDTSTHVWFEAKGNGSVLFIVPPVRDCSVQFIVACPRTYSNTRTLDDSKVTVTGVRYLVSSKADGLFEARNGEDAKILASTLATTRIDLPSSWSSENISDKTPNASVKIQRPLETSPSSGKFSSVSVPFRDAIEAHLEFGTTSSVKRIVRSRATVDVSPFTFEAAQPVRIERSEVPLNPGSCIVISRRKETHY